MKQITIGQFPELEYAAAEAMNRLVTNLSFCGPDVKVIEITSRYASEGKSFTAMNMMRTFAALGKAVVLVDTDLRRSMINKRFHLHYSSEDTSGLAQYLAGMCSLEDIIYQTNIVGAYMIPIGRSVSSSLQLLSHQRFSELLAYLAATFDVVLVDTAPVGVIADAMEVARSCDGALIVVGYNIGRRREIADVAEQIRSTGCPVLGVALNNVKMNAYSNRHYYYKKGYYKSYYKSYEKIEDDANAK